jgi:1-acyl-sn-glycerol-3-phosphate acyltransferase
MDSTTRTTTEIDARDQKKYYFTDTPQRRALVGLARSLFKLVMTMDVAGLENFPRQGPVVLTANHVTNFDVFPMQFALPRPIFFMSCSGTLSWVSFSGT